MPNHKQFIKYKPSLKEKARELRNNMTKSEVLLWMQLKGKQRLGYDFHRQKPIDWFIVDFYCPGLRFAIEIDGYSHLLDETKNSDVNKERRLKTLGIHLLRIDDHEIFSDIDNVIKEIDLNIRTLEG